MPDPKPVSEPKIPADLIGLWEFLKMQTKPFEVDPEDMKAFILRLAKAEENLAKEKREHFFTNARLVEAQATISTTCKKWLQSIEEGKKKS